MTARFPCLLALAGAVQLESAFADVYRVNGIALAVERHIVTADPTALAAQVRASWNRREPTSPVSQDVAGGSIVLGQLRGGLHQTLHLRPIGTSGQVEIIGSTTDLRIAPRAIPQLPLLFPFGTRLLSVVEPASISGTTTFLGSSTGGAETLQAAVARRALLEGWYRQAPDSPGASRRDLHWWIRGAERIGLRTWPNPSGCRFILVYEKASTELPRNPQ